MAERAVFLDRDNTILEDREGYIGDPAKVRLLPGAATALAAMRRLGFRIIVASNQSGVARGMFTEADVEAVNNEMVRQLRQQANALIDASYYCPYHPEAVLADYRMDHEWRKPKCGMLKQAAEDFALDLSQSWMIGDSERDIACGAAAGCRTILIRDPERPAPGPGQPELTVSPNYIVRSLADAARIIAREARNPHPDLVAKPAAADTPAALAPVAPVPTAEKPSEPAAPAESVAEPATPRVETSLRAEETAPAEPATPAPPAPPAPAETAKPVAEAEASVSPTPAVATPVPTPVAPPTQVVMDADALGAAIAKHLAPTTPRPQENLKPVLEEILTHLRRQSREGEVIPEFSLARLIAVLAQVAVAACLFMAFADAISALPPKEAAAWTTQIHLLMRSGLWLLTGVILQGFVIAITLLERRK